MKDFSRRSPATELMETEAVSPADFAACLADLAAVNTVTLARLPTLAFLRRVVRTRPRDTPLRILDVGSGEGDMARRIARWGARRGLDLSVEGIDLNPSSTAAARAATPPGLPVSFRTGDVFDEPPGCWDVVISSLFTHHLADSEVSRFLSWMEGAASRGWFINDLHRHALAYYGFTALSAAAGWHRFVRHDGPVSVARSFRRADWLRLLQEAGLGSVATIRWHVPFRFCVSRVK